MPTTGYQPYAPSWHGAPEHLPASRPAQGRRGPPDLEPAGGRGVRVAPRMLSGSSRCARRASSRWRWTRGTNSITSSTSTTTTTTSTSRT
eukprot:8777401-Heterocapsa_arctica.AAC.1